jgi:RepB DNA-primase from phage plasmid
MSTNSREESAAPLRGNRLMARKFLDALGGGTFAFQTFDDDATRKNRSLGRVLHGTINQHFTSLEKLNAKGAGIFATINRTDGKGRKRDNVVGIRAVFVDLDGAPLAPIMQWALPPHIVVESSPGRYHAYWLVDDTVALTEFTGLQKKLAKLFGGDPKVHDLPRVLRLPGFIHRKGEPFRTRVTHHNATLPCYSASKLISALADVRVTDVERPTRSETPTIDSDQPIRSKTPAIKPDQPGNIQAAIYYLQHDAEPAVEHQQGNNGTYTIVTHVRGHFGLSEEKCFKLMWEYFNPRCEPEWSADELQTLVHNGYAYSQSTQGAESAEAEFGADPLPPPTEAEEAASAKARKASEAKREAKPEQPRKPVVVIQAGNLPGIARKVKRILMGDARRADCPASDQVFRRGTGLVHLNRNRLDPSETVDKEYHVEDDLVVRTAELDWLGDRAERCICFFRVKKGQFVACDVPDKLMRRVQAIITSWDFPPLLGTVEAPTLRPDGSLLDVPGYDRRSGLYYDPGRAVFPKIASKPNKQQAQDALAKLRAILADFPFNDSDDDQEGLSESVALAILLTAVVRRSLPTAPMFGIDAYEAQSGKTLLSQLAAIMATGRKTAERPWSASEEERRKALGAALEAGDAVILYDNVDTPLEGAAFAGAITESLFKDRRLGSNSGKDQIVAPTNALLLATGNHLTAKGDMTEGRVLVARIVPDRELAQRDYQHRDLADYVIEHRPELVAAALTVLLGFLVSPLKDRPKPAGFRHRAWGDLIAASLQWLGLPDPCLAMGRTQAADPEREAQCDVVRIWAQRYGEEYVTTTQLIEVPTLDEALAGLAGVETRKLEVKGAAAALRNMVGLARLGYKVHRVKGHARHASKWRLENVAGEIEQELPIVEAPEFADDLLAEDQKQPWE